jgi:hypothetical protein
MRGIKINLYGKLVGAMLVKFSTKFSLIFFNSMIISSVKLTASLKSFFSFCSNLHNGNPKEKTNWKNILL